MEINALRNVINQAVTAVVSLINNSKSTAVILIPESKEIMLQQIHLQHRLFACHRLEIETLMMGNVGGMEQIASKISFDEVDLVFYFRSTDPSKQSSDAEMNLLRLCDVQNIPLATNVKSAEIMLDCLSNGGFATV